MLLNQIKNHIKSHSQKIKTYSLPVTLSCVAFLPVKSFALVSAQAYLGNRAGSITLNSNDTGARSQTLKNSELGLSVLLDPIPLVPLAFGVGVIQQDFKVSATTFGFDTLKGVSMVPEVQAWLPLSKFKPYVRLGYALGGYKGSTTATIAATSLTYSATLKGSGKHIGAGIKFEPLSLPLVHLAFFGEYNMHSYKFADQNLDPSLKALMPTTPYHNRSWNGAAVLFGVEAGI